LAAVVGFRCGYVCLPAKPSSWKCSFSCQKKNAEADGARTRNPRIDRTGIDGWLPPRILGEFLVRSDAETLIDGGFHGRFTRSMSGERGAGGVHAAGLLLGSVSDSIAYPTRTTPFGDSGRATRDPL
jgi:hypothetical protein